jgi:hypothetical protein
VVNQMTKTQEVIEEVLTTKNYMIVAANNADKLAMALKEAIDNLRCTCPIIDPGKSYVVCGSCDECKVMTRIEIIMGGGDETK